MRAYQVTVKNGDKVLGTRFAGTQAESRSTRDELVTQFDVKKSAVEIEEVEIPTAKPDLLVWVNELSTRSDAAKGGE